MGTPYYMAPELLDGQVLGLGLGSGLASHHPNPNPNPNPDPNPSPDPNSTGQPYGCAADVWALGVIGFELLALRRPFVAKRMADLKAIVLASDFSSISADHQPGRTAAQVRVRVRVSVRVRVRVRDRVRV